ncbi:hypothetical protein ABKN59_008542 [Abortiporus biennis]
MELKVPTVQASNDPDRVVPLFESLQNHALLDKAIKFIWPNTHRKSVSKYGHRCVAGKGVRNWSTCGRSYRGAPPADEQWWEDCHLNFAPYAGVHPNTLHNNPVGLPGSEDEPVLSDNSGSDLPNNATDINAEDASSS